VRAIAEGVTETAVAGDIANALYSAGSTYVSHPIFMGSGTRSALCHCTPEPTPIPSGSPVFMEVGASSGRMHASTSSARAQRRERKDASAKTQRKDASAKDASAKDGETARRRLLCARR
jgi:hypothetical protein